MGDLVADLLRFVPESPKAATAQAKVPERKPKRVEIDPDPTKGLVQFLEFDSQVPMKSKKDSVDSFYRGIAAVESPNLKDPYGATNPSTSASGKYQFMWSTWGDDISKFAGKPVTREEFLNNPQLQEDFARHYYHNVLTKEADEIQKGYPNSLRARNLQDPDDIKSLLHFLGKGNLTHYLRTGDIPDKIKENNVSVSEYLDIARKARLQ